jgi:hypothetical protein
MKRFFTENLRGKGPSRWGSLLMGTIHLPEAGGQRLGERKGEKEFCVPSPKSGSEAARDDNGKAKNGERFLLASLVRNDNAKQRQDQKAKAAGMKPGAAFTPKTHPSQVTQGGAPSQVIRLRDRNQRRGISVGSSPDGTQPRECRERREILRLPERSSSDRAKRSLRMTT